MQEDTLPGATLEAPETFRVLLAPLWPRLSLGVGYRGPARWVALYVSSDHAIYNDGAGLASGDTSLFLAFKRHPVVAPHLAGAHLGSADEEAREWLLIDQAQQLLYLAESGEALRFLAAQWPRYDVPLEDTGSELARLLEDGWQEISLPSDWHERLAETVRESRANYVLMMRWLDQQRAGER
jgi:hypothetical protein